MSSKLDTEQLITAYRQVIDSGNVAPFDIKELEQILNSGDYFRVPVCGRAEREKINQSLQFLKEKLKIDNASLEWNAVNKEVYGFLKDRIETLTNSALSSAEAQERVRKASFDRPEVVPDFQWSLLLSFMVALENETTFYLGYYEAYLFGSYATGRARAGSDLDVAIVSESFIGIPWERRIAFLKGLTFGIGVVVNPVGLTHNELKSYNYPTLIRSIRNLSVRIR